MTRSWFVNYGRVMPDARLTIWAHVDAGMTVLGRDGSPRVVGSVALRHDGVLVDGAWLVEHRRPCVVLDPTMQEATLAILKAFDGVEFISYDRPDP